MLNFRINEAQFYALKVILEASKVFVQACNYFISVYLQLADVDHAKTEAT